MHEGKNDERFERYLASFRPLAAPRLQVRRARWRAAAWGAGALATAAALLVVLFLRHSPESPRAHYVPLTIADAGNRLASAASWRDVLDDPEFVFPRARVRGSSAPHSAIEILSRQELPK